MPRSRRTLLLSLLIIAAVFATFGRVIGQGFVNWDDQGQIFQNPAYNPPTVASVLQFWSRPHMNLYMPVTYTLWGAVSAVAQREAPGPMGELLDARYFHALNVALHAAAALAVFALLRRLVGREREWAAAAGALLFALHPLQAEPVAWASAMYTVLSGALSLAALWQYVVFAQRDAEDLGNAKPSRKWVWFATATLTYALALLAKPSAVVLPAVMAAIDLLLVRRPPARVAVTAGLWLALAMPIMIVASRAQPATLVEPAPLWLRPVVAADAVAFYFGKLIAPITFIADYGRSPDWLIGHPARYVTWLPPVAVLALAWRYRRSSPWLLAGFTVFVAGMGTYLGLVKFDFQYYSTVADRYAYLSLLGPAIVVAYALARVARRWRGAAVGVMAVALIALAVRSSLQTRHWRDTESLFGHTLAVNPRSLVARNVLGYFLAARGEHAEAIAQYRDALDTRPNDPYAHTNLANALLAIGRPGDAIGHYRAALKRMRGEASVYNNLGVALAQIGDLAAAADAFNAALSVNPHYAEARDNLARAQARLATTAPAAP